MKDVNNNRIYLTSMYPSPDPDTGLVVGRGGELPTEYLDLSKGGRGVLGKD